MDKASLYALRNNWTLEKRRSKRIVAAFVSALAATGPGRALHAQSYYRTIQ